jgi:Ca-activated chloride channel family protein
VFFLYPTLLFLLFLPFVLVFYFVAVQHHPLHQVFSISMQKKLSLPYKGFSTFVRNILFSLVLAMCIIALARPVTKHDTLESKISKTTVILALDVSKSMHKTDIYPTRLALAKKKLQRFISQSTQMNIGILLYAKDAYMLYPVSQNPKVLLSLLEESNLTRTFQPQSNLFAALEGSKILLQSYKNRHIILLSDGGKNVQRTKELSYLQSQKIILSSLALAHNTSLQMLCENTTGTYQPYTWGDEDIIALIQTIKAHKRESRSYHYNIAQYTEYFQIPLLLAILILLMMFFPLKSKNAPYIVLLLCYMNSYSTSLNAGVFDFWSLQKAQKAYKTNDYQKAIRYYLSVDLSKEGYYNLATTQYKLKHYLKAIEAYKQALHTNDSSARKAKIYHNIATVYARMGKLKFSKEYYMKSLASQYSVRSSKNLTLIQNMLKVERKSLHKKTIKLQFKAIANRDFAPSSVFTDYAIKLHHFIPSEEDKWFKKIAQKKSPFYLQKLITHQRSIDANITQ